MVPVRTAAVETARYQEHPSLPAQAPPTPPFAALWRACAGSRRRATWSHVARKFIRRARSRITSGLYNLSLYYTRLSTFAGPMLAPFVDAGRVFDGTLAGKEESRPVHDLSVGSVHLGQYLSVSPPCALHSRQLRY